MQGGVAIDLSQLNTIRINKKAGTLTIGPGVRFRDIFDPLYAAGWQIRESQFSKSASARLNCPLITPTSEQKPERRPASAWWVRRSAAALVA